MSRTFAYARVSTSDQTTDNQVEEIRKAGFAIEPHRVITEVVSGSEAAVKRPNFMKLLERLERGDVLIVSRIDRLGRNAMDVAATVKRLAGMGVRVHCLQLGGTDLTSAAGKMVMTVLSAMAEFERDLLIERTQSGLARAKEAGRKPGRPDSLTDAQKAAVRAGLATGASVSALSRQFGTSRQTILRVKASITAELIH
jgi:putative DNA-invertase from lambdoid prophage Rac